MPATRSFHYEPKAFRAGELADALAQVLRLGFADGAAVDVMLFRILAYGTQHSAHNQTLRDLSIICDLAEERTSLLLTFGMPYDSFPGLQRELRAQFAAGEDGYPSLTVDAETPERLRSFATIFRDTLGLVPAPSPYERARAEVESGGDALPPMMQVLEELAGKVAALEQQQQTHGLTCFLSFQFNGVSLGYARQIRHFLELLGVRVVTGEGYEPKPINEKVRQRLQEALDFVVVIEVRERSSAWTRDEIARAQQPGVFLVPLVEQGATFDRGIFGDHEYIEFAPGHVGDAFTGLLEAVTYIRRMRIDTDTS